MQPFNIRNRNFQSQQDEHYHSLILFWNSSSTPTNNRNVGTIRGRKHIYTSILFGLLIVSLFFIAVTIGHQITRIEGNVEESGLQQSRTYDTTVAAAATTTSLRKLLQSDESQISLLEVAPPSSSSKSYQSNYQDLNYKKSECVPRSHTYYDKNTEVTPELFRVQWTVTITPDTTTTDTTATVTNTVKTLTMQFNRTWSPYGVDRMYRLLLDHYFDCAVFFRVVPDFIIQFGIAAEPKETKKWDIIIDDDLMYIQPNIRGTISFATAGPKTRTTQLFMNTIDNSAYLDKMGFTPIGIIAVDDNNNIDDPMNTIIPFITKPHTKSNEDGISQDQYMKYGNPWILQHYPEVDMIINTTIIPIVVANNNDDNTKNKEEMEDYAMETSEDSTTIIGRIVPHEEDPQTHRFQHRQYENGGNL